VKPRSHRLHVQVDHVFLQPRDRIVGIAETARCTRTASAGVRAVAELGPGAVAVMRADEAGGVTNGTAIRAVRRVVPEHGDFPKACPYRKAGTGEIGPKSNCRHTGRDDAERGLLAPQPNAVARGSNGPVLTALVLAVAGATWAVMRAKALIAQDSPAKPWEGKRLTPSASAPAVGEGELSDNDFARILCITLSERYGCLRSRGYSTRRWFSFCYRHC